MLLAMIGGAAGVLLAYLGVSALVALAPPGVPRIEQAGVEARALAFAALWTAEWFARRRTRRSAA